MSGKIDLIIHSIETTMENIEAAVAQGSTRRLKKALKELKADKYNFNDNRELIESFIKFVNSVAKNEQKDEELNETKD